MKKNDIKKGCIYWILQSNQTTPFIIDFLTVIRNRVKEFATIHFLVPAIHPEVLKDTKQLNPVPFQVSSTVAPASYEGYSRKRDLLGNQGFSEGLAFYKALLLDDLGGGHLSQTLIHMPKLEKPGAVFLQIPTPLGSSESEERIFYAWSHWAKQSKTPLIGYELLPLDTRWTLAPSMMDGIITMRQDSFDYLTGNEADVQMPVWLLPRFEGRFFSPSATHLWKNGLGTAYKYMNELPLSHEKTVLYIPHNVAMTYEYKCLIKHLLEFKDDIHLMFSVGKDQVRGTYTHEDTIKLVCKSELDQISHSFHDLNRAPEMTMADAVVACASCYATCVSVDNGIPSLIYDKMVPAAQRGVKKRINTPGNLKTAIRELIKTHGQKIELSRIIWQILRRSHHG